MEPQTLGSGFTQLAAEHPEGHRLGDIARAVLTELRKSTNRRTAVLKYPDLAARLTQPPLNYSKAANWNGWIPPALINPDSTEEILRSPSGRLNQLGKRAIGEIVNDSPMRTELVQISTEAWAREHPPG